MKCNEEKIDFKIVIYYARLVVINSEYIKWEELRSVKG